MEDGRECVRNDHEHAVRSSSFSPPSPPLFSVSVLVPSDPVLRD